MIRRLLVVVLATAFTLGACGDDGGDDGTDAAGDGLDHSTTTVSLDLGGLDLDVPDGFFAVPVPNEGFGLALPEGFQATLLTEDALAQLESAGFGDDEFLDAAQEAATGGALFYAAGVADGAAVTVEVERIDTDRSDTGSGGVCSSEEQVADDDLGSSASLPDRERFTFVLGDGRELRCDVVSADDGEWVIRAVGPTSEAALPATRAILDTFVLAP